MVMLRLELLSRFQVVQSRENYKKILRECAPEAAGIIACITLVAALRARGDFQVTGEDQEAWEHIKREWPLLMTADTLLALQVLLRLVLIISAVLRSGDGGLLPLADEAALLWLGGAIARMVLLTQSTAYMLDGPAGSIMPAACEAAVVPLLLVLSHGSLRRSPVTVVLVTLAVWQFSCRNYLNIASEFTANVLFTAAHSFEFLASFAYLFRTLLIDNGSKGHHVSVGFTHLLMPIQQGLAAYFWLQAFDPDADVNGGGLGIAVIQIGCVVQLGVYLATAALYTAEWFGDQQQPWEGSHPITADI
ncbi:unnamed protein product [Polarella glacialis]|uniref:Uncharacterized protein n=1 Tax=Polarella glacialis TaxID=89957 RepID=A0A813J8V1_POLGL|nr:unnamed protein product [Polarella glacialis]